MQPAVHDYIYDGQAGPMVDLFGRMEALRSGEACIAISIAAALMLAAKVASERPGVSAALGGRGPFAMAAVLLSAIYCLTWGQVDEVAIALEHSFNLYHFGRFSFSPTRMVDGTIEHVYYLLLTPFASSATRLVAANFCLGLLIAWAHLWVIDMLVKDCKASTRAAVLLLYAAQYQIVSQLSNGFGNSLVSLLFLAAIQLALSDRRGPAIALASALPLLRPDAILYSYALLFAIGVNSVDTRRGRSVLSWLAPGLALGLFFVLHHAVYGHWLPTPIAFKSIDPSMLRGEHLVRLAGVVMNYVSEPPRILCILALACTSMVTTEARFVRRLVMAMGLVALFYMLSGCVVEDFTADSFGRYWLGFEQVLFLALSVLLVSAARSLDSQSRWSRYRLVFGRLIPVAVILLVSSGVTWDGKRQEDTRNRGGLAWAGQIAGQLIPRELSLATTELNTFGLAIPDREVLDFYGLTEPAIARSRTRSGLGLKNNPTWFQTVQPDVFFVFEEEVGFTEVEQLLAEFDHFRPSANMLGDMRRVLENYDVVLVRHPLRELVLLVKRSSLAALDDSLRRASYREFARRPLDLSAFNDLYDRVPPLKSEF